VKTSELPPLFFVLKRCWKQNTELPMLHPHFLQLTPFCATVVVGLDRAGI